MATILYNKINVGSSALKGLRIGSSEVKYAQIGTNLVYDIQSLIEYDAPIITLTYPTGATAAAGGTTSPTLSYSQTWARVGYSGKTYAQTNLESGATVVFSIKGDGATIDQFTGEVTWANNQSLTTRTADVTVTVTLNGKSSSETVTITQARGGYSYSQWAVSISASAATVAAAGGTSTITASASRTYGWNGATSGAGTQTGTVKLSMPTTTGASLSGTASGSKLTWANNTTNSSRSVTVTATCQEDTTKTKTVTITQSKGQIEYGDVYATLEYTNKAAAAGGTCTPLLTYGQTYTWNGVSNSGGSVPVSSLTVGNYSLATTTGASINPSTGVVSWVNNTSEDARTSNAVTVTVTGLDNKRYAATATCMQLPGTKVWGNPSITTFSYGTVSAAGGSQNPSLVYTQSYTWNGVSGSGGSVNGNGDDDYSNYVITMNATGLTLNTTSGAVTWAANKGTTGELDATARSGAIGVTVTRNEKTATKEATTVQSGEAVSSTSYGAWTFSITPNTTSIAATGGSVTFTLSRPTRTNTVTLTSGDSYTTTETATSGTFALTRSNTSFALSTTSISMTSSSLPTFTLSVSGTGATTASAISSTVTAKFTASSPTTGTTTASKTSSSVTRAASTLTSTAYKISTFSLSNTSVTAAGGTVKLTMVVQEQKTYTGGTSSWTAITPLSSVLKLTAGTGGSIGTITYGTTSTCNITVSANQSTLSRTITITGTYNTAENSVTITQDKDTISSSTSVISISASSTLLPASGGTSTITRSGTTTNTWVSGRTTTSSFTPTLSISGTGFILSGTTVTAVDRTYIEGPLRSGTVTASYSGATSKSVTIEQEKNTITRIDITLNNTADVPAGGGSKLARCTAVFSSGASTMDVNYFTPYWGIESGDGVTIGDTTENICVLDHESRGTSTGDRLATTVVCAGGSVIGRITYYQEANMVESTVVDSQEVNTLTASSTSIAKEGGSVTITTTGTTVYKDTYTSEDTATRSVSATPALSIPSGSTGWTLSGTTLTAAENTAGARNVVVTATLGSSSKTITVTQAGNVISGATFATVFAMHQDSGASGLYWFDNKGLLYDMSVPPTILDDTPYMWYGYIIFPDDCSVYVPFAMPYWNVYTSACRALLHQPSNSTDTAFAPILPAENVFDPVSGLELGAILYGELTQFGFTASELQRCAVYMQYSATMGTFIDNYGYESAPTMTESMPFIPSPFEWTYIVRYYNQMLEQMIHFEIGDPDQFQAVLCNPNYKFHTNATCLDTSISYWGYSPYDGLAYPVSVSAPSLALYVFVPIIN